MNRTTTLTLASLGILASIGVALARDEMPWTFNGNRAEGYTIDLVSVTPEPGTPLIAGQTADFKVTVRYENKIAPKGKIILVFQADKGQVKADGDPQVKTEVAEKSGTVTLEDRITVPPKKAKELILFIPLVPDGLDETDGEVVIRYPIRKK